MRILPWAQDSSFDVIYISFPENPAQMPAEREKPMFFRSSQKAQLDQGALQAALNKSFACIEFAPDGTILGANENFLRAVGYSLGEIKGKHHSLFVDPAEAGKEQYRAFWRELAAGASQAGEFRRKHKSGGDLWLEAVYNALPGADGKVVKVVKIATDITAKKQQAMLNAGQIDAINLSQAVIEFAIDGTIRSANDNFLKVMGYRADEIAGRHHSLFVAAEYRDSAEYKNFWKKLAAGEFQSGLYSRRAKDGKEVWLQASYNPVKDDTGKVIGVVKFAVDVTARQLESADTAGRMAAINRVQAVIEFTLEGIIVDANANFLNAVGYTLAEVRGKHHSMFVDPAERETPAYKAFWDKLRRGEYQADQYKRVGKGGRIVWIEASYNPVLDAAGKPLKVVKFATDVTQKVMEAQKNKRVSEMLESVASGAEELNISVREISSSMASSSRAASRAADLAINADGASKRLTAAAESMGGIVEVINNITGQINLLALNATIESARAGEAGKGFAVVAGEVKNLANQAKSATERISTEIDGMRGISGDVTSALNAIRGSINELGEYVNSTAAAIEEQSTVAGEMSANMQQAADAARL
jgi:methyl-accepting chemotaxis protein